MLSHNECFKEVKWKNVLLLYGVISKTLKDIKLLQPNVENEQDEETSTISAALEQSFNQNRQNNKETQKTTNDFTYLNALLP
ncbi:11216_t:CDS:2 [Funneliformis caledonium]|uniref:11216_t:CDS:1 n=1 Tax=Funneliformis caledonium TaxID=1117310 RepID=A0A9N9N324_9GLOM|nr:11216_t:CDS:2 [Funneliformis caledonium]